MGVVSILRRDGHTERWRSSAESAAETLGLDLRRFGRMDVVCPISGMLVSSEFLQRSVK